MKRQYTSGSYFKMMTIIYVAQVTAPIILTAIAYSIIDSSSSTATIDFTFVSILGFMLVMGLGTAHLIFNIILKKIDVGDPITKKIPQYFKATIIRNACLEIPALLGAAFAIVNNQSMYLLVPLMIVPFFYLFRPTIAAVVNDLNLSTHEKALLEDAQAIIAETEV